MKSLGNLQDDNDVQDELEDALVRISNIKYVEEKYEELRKFKILLDKREDNLISREALFAMKRLQDHLVVPDPRDDLVSDQAILVRSDDQSESMSRHFAMKAEGVRRGVYCWTNGRTEWTSLGENDVTYWAQWMLPGDHNENTNASR